MDRHAVRLAVCAVASVAVIVACTLVLDWFVATSPNVVEPLRIGLRPTTRLAGVYPTLAVVTFWGSLAFAVIVVNQVVRRIAARRASDAVGRVGFGLGLALIAWTFATGYLFGPQAQSFDTVSLTVVRTWAPALLLVGLVLGIAALKLATTIEAPVPAIVRPSTGESKPLPRPAPIVDEAAVARVAAAITQTALRGKLRFALATAEVSTAGIDARHEDGSARLVLWRDVLGVVARRLPAPPPHDGTTFIDVVSNAGATIRVVPWTRISGVEIAAGDPAREFARLVTARSPDAQLDPATRAFVDGAAPAAQLPDLVTLDAHDARLS